MTEPETETEATTTPSPAVPKRVLTIDDIPKGFLYRFDAWGKPFWNVLHAVTFSYPEKPEDDDKERIRIFFQLVPFYLPCSICGMHFVREMKESPMTDEVVSSMDKLSRWLVDLHNSVNERLKKPLVTYENAKKFYFEDYTVDPRTGPDLKLLPPVAQYSYKKPFWCISLVALVLAIIVIIKIVVPRFTRKTE